MIQTDNFTYIHPLKCGGTFVNEILKDTINSKDLGYHLPRSRVVGEHNFVTTVRNPFDWYVSFYFHSLTYHSYLIRTSESFKDTIIQLLNLKDFPMYDRLLNHDWVGDTTPNLITNDFVDYPDDMGFFSWQWQRMVADKDGNTDDAHVMRLENLREDLIGTFNKFGDVTKYQKDTIMNTPNARVNENRKHYREYYDDALIEMIYKKDKPIFDRFGYEF